jgi:lysine 2,3-aminomutase
VEKEYIVTDNDFIQAFEYIKEEKLQDVLLSGGDPFMLSVERIEWFLHNLSKIQSLKVIRFGSRIISTYPMLITQKLCDILKKYDIKYINTHFNHPKEITIETIKAVNLLRSSGINIGNQTVLLKGINDNNDTMKELCLSLYHIGIKPYYIYHCDMVKGCSKFRTTIEKGISVYQSLRGYVSGPAIPLYILDFPYGLGKVPVNRNYFEKLEENVYRITNYSGKTMIYDERLFNLGD